MQKTEMLNEAPRHKNVYGSRGMALRIPIAAPDKGQSSSP
jgi:hypothetical protein